MLKALPILLALSAMLFTVLDWKTGGFDFLKLQTYEFYFQSWVSLAGILFTFVLAVTTFAMSKKSELDSLKYVSLSFLLTSFAFVIIGYHSSYCEVCSDLSMCGASHNYPNYLSVAAMTIFVLTTLLGDIIKNVKILKLFAYSLILASSLMVGTLFFSIYFMEIPDLIPYVLGAFNLQGFVFLLPSLAIALLFVYFKNAYKLSNAVSAVMLLLFISLAPQTVHIFFCDECHNLECSEFYVFSGMLMTIAIGALLYAIRLQLEEKK